MLNKESLLALSHSVKSSVVRLLQLAVSKLRELPASMLNRPHDEERTLPLLVMHAGHPEESYASTCSTGGTVTHSVAIATTKKASVVAVDDEQVVLAIVSDGESRRDVFDVFVHHHTFVRCTGGLETGQIF